MQTQQAAKISSELLKQLIHREFPNVTKIITTKLELVISDSEAGKRRISAAILKLANRNVNQLDSLIEKANYDFRDIVSAAEYPKNSKHGFDERTEEQEESELKADSVNYMDWLSKTE